MIEGATVATTIVQGTIGELQKMLLVKLSSASQIKVTNVPNRNAFRRAPLRNGSEYLHNACTIRENGNATTRVDKIMFAGAEGRHHREDHEHHGNGAYPARQALEFHHTSNTQAICSDGMALRAPVSRTGTTFKCITSAMDGG